MQELLALQTKALEKSNALSITAAANDDKMGEVKKDEAKRVNQLNENLKSLKDVIKDNIKHAMDVGGAHKLADNISNKNAEQANDTRSGLRKFLLGDQKGESTESHVFGFSKVIDKMLSKMEEKQAYEKEKKDYVSGALKHDPNTYRVANFHGGMDTAAGKAAATQKAEEDFHKIKEKEKEVTVIKEKIESAKKAGYNPLVKDEKALAKAGGELAQLDNRVKKDFAPAGANPAFSPQGKSVVQAKDGANPPLSPQGKSVVQAKLHDEEKEEAQNTAAKFNADNLKAEHDMGASLIQSLDIQKQQLEALKKLVEMGGTGGGGGAGESSSGGGLIESAMDMAGDLMGNGKNAKGAARGGAKAGAGKVAQMGGKAMNFLKGNGGKLLGAVGAVGMGAYEAYSGWQDANANEKQQNEAIDAKVAAGEISEADAKKMKAQVGDATDVKKGEAVGGGVGGAGGALAGAAAGAAIGSVVPVVGTAIGGLVGGALGYYGGSKIGEKVGGSLTSGYKSVKNFLGFGSDENKEGQPQVVKKEDKWTEIAGERVVPGQELSQKQMAVMGMAIQSGNSYSPEIMQQYNKQKNSVTGSVNAPDLNKPDIGGASEANAAAAQAQKGGNNVLNNATTINNNAGGGGKAENTFRSPVRNPESSNSRYLDSKYA